MPRVTRQGRGGAGPRPIASALDTMLQGGSSTVVLAGLGFVNLSLDL